MRTLVSLLLLVFLLSLTSTLSYAIATVTSSGTISVDWDQNTDVISWDPDSSMVIYGMNGADAIWGTENFTLDDNGNRIYDESVSDYGGGWFDNLNGVIDTSSAGYGSSVLGKATTTITSVSSSGYVSNDGEGLTLNASGTSHLVRDFTVLNTGDFTFDASYTFTDSSSLDNTAEWTDFGHHASLTLSYLDLENGWTVLDREIIAYGYGTPMSDPSAAGGTLSVYDDGGWKTTGRYAIELHTYNSASAYSPANEVTPVPEPATLILLGSGLAGLAFYRRKRK